MISSSIKIPVRGGELAAYSFGKGPVVLFLHGGPGDTHDYMKRMAEPLFDSFQCLFFDQRGTGGSSGFLREASTFRMENLLTDIVAVADHFEVSRPTLVGHSWGAMYALFACIRFPDKFCKAALLSMGPLDDEMGQATAAHLTSVLNSEEAVEWTRLRQRRNTAREAGDVATVNLLDEALMRLRVRAWVFNPELRAAFLEEYLLDPPPDRDVNKWIWSKAANWLSWDSLKRVQAELWICTGANDSVPLKQTERILEAVAGTSAHVIQKCGHMPWLEYPQEFYRGLQDFLRPTGAAR